MASGAANAARDVDGPHATKPVEDAVTTKAGRAPNGVAGPGPRVARTGRHLATGDGPAKADRATTGGLPGPRTP